MWLACLPGQLGLNRSFRRFSFFRSRILVRSIAFCLLAIHLALISGICIPIPRTSKQVVERFPCEECPCGCASAAYCWDRCCCYSDEEKLSWAERNRVRPPEFLVQRVKSKAASIVQSASTVPSCCQAKRASPCCEGAKQTQPSSEVLASGSSKDSKGETAAEHSCCSEPVASRTCCQNKSTTVEQPVASEGDSSRVKLVMLDPALRCLGIEMALALFSNTWIPDTGCFLEASPAICIEWLRTLSETGSAIYLPVDGPVPKVC